MLKVEIQQKLGFLVKYHHKSVNITNINFKGKKQGGQIKTPNIYDFISVLS